ncbi:hypothetical protein D3C79_604140 [compost metagenome]
MLRPVPAWLDATLSATRRSRRVKLLLPSLLSALAPLALKLKRASAPLVPTPAPPRVGSLMLPAKPVVMSL